MSLSTFSWHAPPLPNDLTVPGYTYRTSPEKIWNRRLWAYEAIFAIGSFLQPNFADIICACQFTVQGSARPLDVEHVRRAVRDLRFEQPAVASRLAWRSSLLQSGAVPGLDDAHFVYEEVSSSDSVGEWAQEVVLDRSAIMGEAGGDLSKAIDLVRREVAHTYGSLSKSRTLFNVCYIAKDDAEAAIIVRGGHALFDASGLVSCMDRIVASIARQFGSQQEDRDDAQWGDETLRLRGAGLEYTLRSTHLSSEECNNVVLARAVEAMKSMTASVGLQVPRPAAQEGTTAVVVRSMGPDALHQLLAATRAHQCTIHTVAFAAAALAALDIDPSAASRELCCHEILTPVNMRHKGLLDDDHVLSALCCNVVCVQNVGQFVNAGSDALWAIAREVRTQLDEQKMTLYTADEWMNGLLSALMTGPLDKVRNGSAQNARAPDLASLRVTSAGVIDQYLQHTHEFPGGSVAVSAPIISVALSYSSPLRGIVVGAHHYTWHGTFYVCFSFPEAHLESLEDQERDSRDGLRRGSVIEWVNALINRLESAGTML